jgi:ribbon-helix-helix CopG family protein
MERTQISLTTGQARELRRLARKRGTSMAALIREAVDRTYGVGLGGGARWERALASIGGFRSDRADVSERHDEHVADAYDG